LLELRGAQIARLRNFSAVPAGILAAALRGRTPRLACGPMAGHAGLAENGGVAP
jgi:hypothetical protein